MILSICDSADILSVFRLVRITLLIVRISVPILLLLSLSIEFMKAITVNDADLLKKASSNAVRKATAAVLVFLVPTFLRTLMDIATTDDLYSTCLKNSTSDNIENIYETKAASLVESAKGELSDAKYSAAMRVINKLNDETLKEQYTSELSETKAALEAKELIDKAKRLKTTSAYEKASTAVEALEEGDIKDELTDELELVSYTISSYMAQYSSDGEYISNMLGLPRYDQCDERWGSIEYTTEGKTFCRCSCGYTSFSIIAAGLKKDMTITPVTVVSTIKGIDISAGQKISGSCPAGTGELVKLASLYGINVENNISLSTASLQNYLNQGKALLVLIPGHYIVIAPSGKTNTAVLIDPYSTWADSRRKSGEYTLQYIFSVYGNPTWAAAYWR